MGKWLRLAVMLGIIGGAGILLVHRQTAIIVKGYRLSKLSREREDRREGNRLLRIALEGERHPEALARRAKKLGIDLTQPSQVLYKDTTSFEGVVEILKNDPRTSGEEKK